MSEGMSKLYTCSDLLSSRTTSANADATAPRCTNSSVGTAASLGCGGSIVRNIVMSVASSTENLQSNSFSSFAANCLAYRYSSRLRSKTPEICAAER